MFAGQPYLTPSYRMDRGSGYLQQGLMDEEDFTGWRNHPIIQKLRDEIILANLQKVQLANRIAPSERLEGREEGYHLTVEMETGVGKTYTYIKTMFELNRAYGWSKFIVVVPSVAIREGVYQSFLVTQEHFAEEYGKKIHFFIYHSSQPAHIDYFASDSSLHVMIINAQAFGARGKDARRIYRKLDEFRSRRPIDIIAGTNPILILDEPQSVEGKQTRQRLREFHPLFTLRYSATHKSDRIYNMVYRLDAMDAYNRRLVKKIAVKGITVTGRTATDSYLYLEGINRSGSAPTATLQFEVKTAGGSVKKKSRIVRIGENLYDVSGGLEEYREGFVVRQIDGRDDSVEFGNGLKIHAGDVTGAVEEEQLRRIQIRETILSHIERERSLFGRGIKVLSLFFIDEVAKYREYDEAGMPVNGAYARMFEEEYREITENQAFPGEDAYGGYLRSIPAEKTHAGYFSVDGKGRMVNGRIGRKEGISDDVSAYELIMKNKELLLDRDPERSPVRFIFSHSALREGWDNPNVFQICTLKQSASTIRKRQEVGRGLRLCVNCEGERMDADALGDEVHSVNVLTVIASESYDSFARGLQTEMAEAVADRTLRDEQGNEKEGCGFGAENARSSFVQPCINKDRLNSREFAALWSAISRKSVYRAWPDPKELIARAVHTLNDRLHVQKTGFCLESGVMNPIGSREALLSGMAFEKERAGSYASEFMANAKLRYDLIGKLADGTGLTRKAVAAILQALSPEIFAQFRHNPEEFIARAGALIREEKAAELAGHITYHALEEHYDLEILTAGTARARPGVNAMKAEKHLFDYVIYDSFRERDFAMGLECDERVAVYVKLPDGFSISTPVGQYTPDWAIAFYEEADRGTYFVVETKGAMSYLQQRKIEELKIRCAREHFRAIAEGKVSYEVADSIGAWKETF